MAAPLKGTFFAFRRRARGGVILTATVVHVVLTLALIVGVVAVNYGFLERVAEAGANDGSVAPITLVAAIVGALFLYAVIMASYEAALLRWMIRGETAGFGGFSLGGDTWRVYLGQWLWFLLGTIIWIATALIAGIAMAVAEWGQQWSAEANWWVGYVIIGLWVLLATPFALRMCTGNAASIARRKFSYFQSWSVSRERSLALLGSFVTHWLIWTALWLALFLGATFVVFSVLGDDAATPPETTNLWMSIGMAVSLFVANLVMAVLSAGTNARAVLAAIEEGKLDGMTPDLAKVFD